MPNEEYDKTLSDFSIYHHSADDVQPKHLYQFAAS